MSDIILSGATVYAEDAVIPAGALQVRDERIHAIGSQEKLHDTSATRFDFPADYKIVPGFIDMHVHGAAGYDVMDADSVALATISRTLAAEGTTAFLATTMTAEVADIERALVAVQAFCQKTPIGLGATVLGVHLEGPFLAPSKMGAQPGEKIIAPDVALVQQWQNTFKPLIKMITLAPEQPQALELIAYLAQHHIIASIGHTNATFAEAEAAIAAGCSHATHLFNAMRNIHHREPGAVTAALLSPDVMVELILDGIHLHPAIADLTLRLKTKNRIALVTDAIRAKCLAAGQYDLGGQTVHVHQGEARLADGTLAGSVLTMATALQNMLSFTGCHLEDVLHMTSVNPARALGLWQHKGSLGVGKDADVVVLNDALAVVMTICQGQVVYQAVL